MTGIKTDGKFTDENKPNITLTSPNLTSDSFITYN